MCAYCRLHETLGGTQRNFVVEHFRPRNRFPALTLEYSNLYYSCAKCNDNKSGTWPSDEQISLGFFFADPCKDDIYSKHLKVRPDGTLDAITSCGRYTSEHLRLYRATLRDCRAQRFTLLQEMRRSLRYIRAARKIAAGKGPDEMILLLGSLEQMEAQLAVLRQLFRPEAPED
jgi:uncharacterized protein (TIGR02646 family)